MALKAGYVGVKRWLYEKLQATTSKNVQDIADIWSNNDITGVKNFLINKASSGTINGVVWTVSADGTCTAVSGTATTYDSGLNLSGGDILLPKGTYRLSGCPAGGSTSTYQLFVGVRHVDSTPTQYVNDTGSGATFVIDDNTSNIIVTAYVRKDATANNYVFKPMISRVEDPGTDYQKGAMTNRQLTNAYEIVNKTGVTYDATYCDTSTSTASLSVKGNIAQFIGVVKITTQVPQYTKFIEGLPAVKSSGGAAFNFAMLSSADGTKTYRCYLDTYGKISAHVTPIPVGSYVISIVYFCAEDSGVYTRSLDAAHDTRELSPEVIEDDPEPVTKTTRKSTKKEDN